ncbi:MAG: sugar isomerase [Bacteroidetes bacterium]|nr:MAG: sugar isomerase [Bacteroidota bacterium]
MDLDDLGLKAHNQSRADSHQQAFARLADTLTDAGADVEALLSRIQAFQVAIPSWALGTGGTRFGRFPGGGEPRSLEEKIADVGVLHALNRNSGAISLHIPWDIPTDPAAVRQLASHYGLVFDAVNSNTFQDQPDQAESYKFGSLCHADPVVRAQAVAHNLEVIQHGLALGSQALTVWLADGSSFPGQLNFRKAFARTLESMKEIYAGLPSGWQMFVEYKAFEPNFYSMVVQDWGSALLFTQKLGPQAKVLVDLGHHLPNANIEQIVALLMAEGKLGGFHFNDSKYGDDDLTVGAIKPYQLFLIFCELVYGMQQTGAQPLAWMIDASHNLKDPLEDLLQSVEAMLLAYAQALLVDQAKLEMAREANDVVMAQELLQGAFRTDLRPLLAEARRRAGGAIAPLTAFREAKVRAQLIRERGHKVLATGL